MSLAKLYGKAISHAFMKEINWGNDTIKIALLTDAYVPNQDAHEFFSDVAAHEITGAGYITGGVNLTSKSITYRADTNELIFDADDITWSNATLTARYAVVYDAQSGSAATSPLISYTDFSTNMSSTNMDLKLTVSVDGVFKISTL